MVRNLRTKVKSIIYTIGGETSTFEVTVASTVHLALVVVQEPVFPVFVSTETLVTSLYAGVPEPWTYGVTRAGL